MAVYTEVTDEALAAFLTDYDIGSMVAFRGIAEGVENSNFSLRTTAGDFILTLYEKRVNPDELPWFLGLMEHLAAQGLVCPQPVRGRDGAALRQLCGKYAAVTTFLPGVWPRRVRPEHCGPVGAALAALHKAGVLYPATRPNALGPAGWAPLLARCVGGADAVQPGLSRELPAALGHILLHYATHAVPNTLCLNCFTHHLPHPCRLPRQNQSPHHHKYHPDCPRCHHVHPPPVPCPSTGDPPPPPPPPRPHPTPAAASATSATHAADFYSRLAAHWKKAYAGWTAHVLTPELRLPGLMRLKESRRVPMWNGPIECRLFRFDMVAGSARDERLTPSKTPA
jgi:hypothetical protein